MMERQRSDIEKDKLIEDGKERGNDKTIKENGKNYNIE